MDLNLGGKVAWVAGGTGALGAAIALALAREGARPVITSRRADAVDVLRQQHAAEQAEGAEPGEQQATQIVIGGGQAQGA